MASRDSVGVLILLLAVGGMGVAASADETGTLKGLYAGLRRSGGFFPKVSADHLVFFEDGTVYWRLPEEGLLGFDAEAARNRDPEFWGRYVVTGETIRVVWPGGKVSEGVLGDPGSVVLDGYTYWMKDPADGYRLSGTYRPSNLDPGDDLTITFFGDGRFQDDGVRVVVGRTDLAYGRPLVATHPGRGTYDIGRNSLTLQYDDGRREALAFYVSDTATTTPEYLVIHGYTVVPVSTVPDAGFGGDFAAIREKAEAGEATAQLLLGKLYADGEALPGDDVEAARWIRKAAEQGLAEAEWVLAFLYYEGRGVPRDPAAALRWYRRAAEKGLPGAQLSLAHLYLQGLGVERDESLAAEWFRRAAEQGEQDAQYALGTLYAEGRGLPRDLVKAWAWLDVAARTASAGRGEESIAAREKVARLMDQKQIEEAMRLARDLIGQGPVSQHPR